MLLADLRGFSRLTDELPEERIVELLNAFFDLVVPGVARQQIAVPPRQFGQSIIRDHVGAPLGRGEIGQTNRRNLLQAEHLRGFDPAMAGDDLAVIRDEDGIDEAKPLDRLSNLFQLLLGMGAGIARRGTQALGPKVCDLKIRCRPGRRPCADGSRNNVVKIRTLDHGRLPWLRVFHPNQVHDPARASSGGEGIALSMGPWQLNGAIGQPQLQIYVQIHAHNYQYIANDS